jgi:parallel beta-helix repeat protein
MSPTIRPPRRFLPGRWAVLVAVIPTVALLLVAIPPLLTVEAQSAGTPSTPLTTLVVNPGDSDPTTHETIQSAIDAAAPGSTIQVNPATYPESPVVSKLGLTIVGNGDGVIIRGADRAAFTVNATGVTLRDLAIEAVDSDSDGVAATGANGLTIERVKTRGAFLSAFAIQSSSDVRLVDTFVFDAQFNAVLAIDTTGLNVTGGEYGSVGRGIHVLRGTGASLSGMIVSAGAEDGLVLEDTSLASVDHASLRNGVWGLWVLRSTGTAVTGVEVVGPSDQGVRVEDSNATTLTDVTVRMSDTTKPGVGVHVSGGRQTTAVGLVVEGTTQNGITVRDTDGFDARNVRVGTVERGLHFLNVANVHLDGVLVFNVGENGLVVEDGSGTTRLANLTLSGPSEWGLWVIRTDGTDLQHVVINNFADRGLRIEDSTGVTASAIDIGLGTDVQRAAMGFEVVGSQDVRLSEVAVRKADNVGGVIGQSSGVTLDLASFQDGGRGLHIIDGTDVTISNSSFNDLKDNGIVVEPGAGVKVLGNQFDGGQRDAIGIWFRGLDGQGPGNEAAFNQVSGYRSSGISLDRGAQGVSIHDNEVTGNSKGIKIVAGGGNDGTEVTAPNQIDNNTVTGNTWGIWSEDSRGNNTVRGGKVSGNSVCDFVVRGAGGLQTTGVDFGSGATAENRTRVGAQAGAKLADCGGRTVSAKSLTDHSCDPKEWAFVINQVRNKGDAPASIFVRWQNGDNREVRLDRITGQVAHYTTTEHLDQPVTEATARMPANWSGQFNLSHGPCFTS